MNDFEKLGAFYLGRPFDLATRVRSPEPLLYDARDLTTHGVCVGMTGSGKTGLCLALLEEAAIDGIPAIAIDPKGDLGNLALAFPDLAPDDFAPWIDAEEAARKGRTPGEHASAVAETWRKGLADWGQDDERIRRLKAAADVAIYTPGSSAGLPVTILRSFAAPPPALAADDDAVRERVASSVAGLLALLGIDADPVRSREHILLSTLLDRAWREGRDLDLAALIREIQTPPFARIGVMDLESFYPAKDRFALAMLLNNLLASPGFAAWLEGEPLDVPRLLFTPEGRPRIAIFSIAHLSETERMFFVTLLLNEVLAWVRTQPGTSSLRALLYMDEIFGFFPPTANPPSKTPMLTLLKQARAYGLGVLLATQNPVDLDYKGLSNAGTWFIGRLQTERDKARVLDGLEGAAAGRGFDRAAMDRTLSSLGNRVFLMHDVHEDGPVVFETRWVMSYLRGPLTRVQIQRLTASRNGAGVAGSASPQSLAPPPAAGTPPGATVRAPEAVAPAPPAPPSVPESTTRPILPPDVPQFHADPGGGAAPASWRPVLLAQCQLHYVAAKHGVDAWTPLAVTVPFPQAGVRLPLESATILERPVRFGEGAPAGTRFEAPPGPAAQARQYAGWRTQVVDHLVRTRTLTLWHAPAFKATSRPGESPGDFQARLALMAREQRDREVDALRAKYGAQVARIRERIRTAEERVAREQAQYGNQKVQTAISFGATLLGALLGRKAVGAGTVGRAMTAARGVGRASRERDDVARAEQALDEQRRALAALEDEARRAMDALAGPGGPVDTVEVAIAPRKSDVSIERFGLAWVPAAPAVDDVAVPSFP